MRKSINPSYFSLMINELIVIKEEEEKGQLKRRI